MSNPISSSELAKSPKIFKSQPQSKLSSEPIAKVSSQSKSTLKHAQNVAPEATSAATISPVSTAATSKKTVGSFSLFGDDNWSAVSMRRTSEKGKDAAQPNSKPAAKSVTNQAAKSATKYASVTSKSISASKGAAKVVHAAKPVSAQVESTLEPEVIENPEPVRPSSMRRKTLKALPHKSSMVINALPVPVSKSPAVIEAKSDFGADSDADSGAIANAETEAEIEAEVVHPSRKLSQPKEALDAIVDDDDEGVADTSLEGAENHSPSLSLVQSSHEMERETDSVSQAPLEATPVETAPVVASRRRSGSNLKVQSKSSRRVMVPDPSLTDSELDVKELEVLNQIKEFNAQQIAADAEEAENARDFYPSEDDDSDELEDGMHLEHYRDNDSSESEEEDEETSSSSRAVVRSAGNIASFIRIANQEPLLTIEQEKMLAERYRKYDDIEAARKLVTSHLRLVVSVAHGYAGYGLPLPDLIQEGNVGLMKAVMHFDPDSGRLAAFAVHWIRAEINDYVIRNWRMVKVATTKAQRKLFFNLRQLKKHLGWFTENERQEVANNLGVTTSDVAEMETRLAGLDIGFDLDEDDSGSDKSVAVTVSPSSYLEDEGSDFAKNFENVDYSAWQIKKLKEALRSLDDRSQYIIKRRWLDDNKATLQELSAELKVSIERVRQIESNAMNKVKMLLINEGVNDADETASLPQLTVKSSSSKALPLAKTEEKAKKKPARKSKAKSADAAADSKATATAIALASSGTASTATKKLGAKSGSSSERKAISKDHSLVALMPEKKELVTNTVEKVEVKPKLKIQKIVDVQD